ncbi:MAG TPA: ribulokinase [Gaiellaceae bacterium]|nr:ribulokinase [Gaiellaceae bacterium]
MRAALGIDYGTESARAVLVDCADGTELGESVYLYANGVIDERLPAPDDDVELEPDWALQDPDDYVRTLREAVPQLLAETGVGPADVIGVGIDFTSCTMLPTLGDGTPLCRLDDLRREPHAWVKLWKHHAAQPEADRINALAAERGEAWLPRYGGKISSEWFFAKALQIFDEAPAVYARAQRLIEACDWTVWQLTGAESRNACAAGYKAMWSKREGFPPSAYFAALDPRFAHVVEERMSATLLPPGARAGGLCERAAEWTGLRAGTPIAVANVDFHASVPATTVTEPGTLVMIMGTSNGHLLLGEELAFVEGMCGVVEDGILPGYYGYEAGQSGLGDIYAWFVRTVGVSHEELAAEAARLRPGESGLLALDWWNGNRSVLVDADLRGLLVGMTLATTAPEIYRTLIEATAFGTRVIVEAFERAGLAVGGIVACGGMPDRNPFLMQVFADVTGRHIAVSGSRQAPALGAAMFGAVAAGAGVGGHDSIGDAARAMAHLSDATYVPNAAHRDVYDRLYGEYLRLHDLFGRGGDDVMRTLKRIQLGAWASEDVAPGERKPPPR